VNDSCPTCGAVYAVAAKDVGRRIKCKKCGTSLEVRESGLEVEAPSRAEDAAPPREARRSSRAPIDFLGMLRRVGGIPTVLFGFGVFFILFTGFQEAIGKAKIDRRQAAIEEGQARMNADQKRHDEKKERSAADDEAIKRLRDGWDKEKKELEDAKTHSEFANKRSGYVDRYVLMLGFLFVAFGSLGFLLGEYGLVLRIVAAAILLFMIMALFKQAVGVSAGVNAGIGLG